MKSNRSDSELTSLRFIRCSSHSDGVSSLLLFILSVCLPDFVEDLHDLLIDDEDDGNVQTHSPQSRDGAFVEPVRDADRHSVTGAQIHTHTPANTLLHTHVNTHTHTRKHTHTDTHAI